MNVFIQIWSEEFLRPSKVKNRLESQENIAFCREIKV